MSIELNLYVGENSVLTQKVLAEQMKLMGWAIRFEDWHNKHLPANDAVLEEEVVSGWRVATNRNALIEDTLGKGNEKQIATLYKENRFGSCVLTILPFVEIPESRLDAIEAKVDASILSAIRRASSTCYTRTSAGRNDLSVGLQESLLRAIGALSGGVFEDPQHDVFELL